MKRLGDVGVSKGVKMSASTRAGPRLGVQIGSAYIRV